MKEGKAALLFPALLRFFNQFFSHCQHVFMQEVGDRVVFSQFVLETMWSEIHGLFH